MAFKTVQVGAWKDVVVCGETISIKCLTNAQLHSLSDEFDAAEKTLDAKLAVIAPYVQIKGIDVDDVAAYLTTIADVKAQSGIIEAVFSQNTLTKSEEKNSASLSDGSKADEPARYSTTTTLDVAATMGESALHTTIVSPVQYRPVTGNLS